MVWQSTEYQFEYENKTSSKYCVPLSKWNISACHCFIYKWNRSPKHSVIVSKFQSLLAKSAENMLLAINKHKWIIMLWHIYINHAVRKKTTIEEVKAKRVLSVIEWRSIYIPFACTLLHILTEGKKKQCPENITKTIDIAHISTPDFITCVDHWLTLYTLYHIKDG